MGRVVEQSYHPFLEGCGFHVPAWHRFLRIGAGPEAALQAVGSSHLAAWQELAFYWWLWACGVLTAGGIVCCCLGSVM